MSEIQTQNLPDTTVDGVSSGLTTFQKSPLEAIREVYRRAVIIHCPTKALIKLQWAAFEEEQGNRIKHKCYCNTIVEHISFRDSDSHNLND